MKALVTGASGFLGAALVRRLRADGVAVRALRRPGGTRVAEADEVCEGDLRHAGDLARAVAGVDWVFHAGARVSTTGTWAAFEATNVEATRTLIQLATAAGVARVVHVSSLSVYAVPHDGAEVTEDSPLETGSDERGHYARSKLAADEAARAAMKAGAPVVIVRPGLLYGPGRPLPLARRARRIGPLLLVFARRGYRLPLAYVDNVADALVLAARSPSAVGRVYTVVDEHAVQDEYLALCRSASGASWRPVYVPVGALAWAVGVAESLLGALGRRSPVSRHQIERTTWSATFSTGRARRELGWEPHVSLETAVLRCLAVDAPAPNAAATPRPAAAPGAAP